MSDAVPMATTVPGGVTAGVDENSPPIIPTTNPIAGGSTASYSGSANSSSGGGVKATVAPTATVSTSVLGAVGGAPRLPLPGDGSSRNAHVARARQNFGSSTPDFKSKCQALLSQLSTCEDIQKEYLLATVGR